MGNSVLPFASVRVFTPEQRKDEGDCRYPEYERTKLAQATDGQHVSPSRGHSGGKDHRTDQPRDEGTRLTLSGKTPSGREDHRTGRHGSGIQSTNKGTQQLNEHRRTGQHPFGGSNQVLPEWRTQIVCHAAPPGRTNNELLQCLFFYDRYVE